MTEFLKLMSSTSNIKIHILYLFIGKPRQIICMVFWLSKFAGLRCISIPVGPGVLKRNNVIIFMYVYAALTCEKHGLGS